MSNTTNQFEGLSFYEERQPSHQPVNHSQAQVDFYHDLCARKHIAPQPVELMTRREIRDAIDTLTKMPDPATTEQIRLIQSTIEELIVLGSERGQLPDAYLTRMNKRDAGVLIEQLFEEKKILSVNAPATREQLITLCTWYICPDIPFEDWGINKIVYLEEMKSWTYDDNRGQGIEVQPFRQMTANEFGHEISRVFKRSDAQAFINQYSSTYYAWKKTRITTAQFERIRQLEEYMHNRRPQQQAVWNPDTQDYTVYTGKGTAEYDGIEYEPMTKRALYMLSKEEANMIIMQLQQEISDSTLRNLNPYDDSQEALTFKHSAYQENARANEYRGQRGDTFARNPKKQDEGIQVEFEKLNNLLFWIESRVGHRNDELRDTLNISIITENNHRTSAVKKQIEDFLLMAVDTRSNDKIDESLKAMYAVMEDSHIGMELFTNISSLFNTQK